MAAFTRASVASVHIHLASHCPFTCAANGARGVAAQHSAARQAVPAYVICDGHRCRWRQRVAQLTGASLVAVDRCRMKSIAKLKKKQQRATNSPRVASFRSTAIKQHCLSHGR